VTILSTDIPAANDFYRRIIYPESVCEHCERPPRRFFAFPSGQTVELREASAPQSNLLLEVSFVTDDLGKLRQFLKANGIKAEETRSQSVAPLIVTRDPEGHQISFIESPYLASVSNSASVADLVAPHRMIHAGFVVHDRAAEDKFYKDILGFRLYWHGGMKDDQDNWVAMQVPDGTDWLEYMLNVPADASHHTLGVMNHISLGVQDIHAIEQQLIKSGVKLTEAPKIGRDGKWQLNLYDPDDTRVEFMEFTPAEKPCCNPFTGPHPGPQK
jgi:catechol 2,3-dioxygenase-like lactoylglutathione lyase family enzyme